MKYISGGDLASRMRAAVGGRIDEKTVTDWGMQVADVLDYLHSRPKPIIYLMSRGMEQDEAMAMIVRGFVEPIAKELRWSTPSSSTA